MFLPWTMPFLYRLSIHNDTGNEGLAKTGEKQGSLYPRFNH